VSEFVTVTVDDAAVVRALSSLPETVQSLLLTLASETGAAIRDETKSLAPVETGAYRDSWISADGGDGTTRVFADTPADMPGNIDLWLEFGTSHSRAQPHLYPAVDAHRDQFDRDAERLVQRAIEEAG
jgi:hypothetical protein